ncbi:MAG: hypothetical protein GDA41_06775 [Rhodospirillales bacterium]|nr:hypothetical protein [Rhodospirillales bacterium]
MKYRPITAVLIVLLGGCVNPYPKIIKVNADQAIIQTHPSVSEEAVERKAEEACALYGKKPQLVYIELTSLLIPEPSERNHFFACVEQAAE